MDENSLCHYGVLGMKWGVRKKKPTSSVRFKKKQEFKNQQKTNTSGNRSKVKKKVRLKDLSNEELQNKVRRLQLEKQYRDLKRDEVSVGKKLLGDILKTSGRTLGVQVANYVGGKAINKMFDDEVVKNIGKKKNKKDKNKDKAE